MFNKGIVSIEKNIKVNADLYSIKKNMTDNEAELRSLEKPKINKILETEKVVNKRSQKSEIDDEIKSEDKTVIKEGDTDV